MTADINNSFEEDEPTARQAGVGRRVLPSRSDVRSTATDISDDEEEMDVQLPEEEPVVEARYVFFIIDKVVTIKADAFSFLTDKQTHMIHTVQCSN